MEMVVGLLGAASVVSALTAAASRRDPTVASRLDPVRRSRTPAARNRGVLSLLAALGGRPRLGAFAGRELLERRRRLAGWSLTVDELVGLKLALACAVGVVGIFAGGVVVGALLIVAGWRIPDIGAARAARDRSRAMDDELPQLLDVLAAASHAGLSGPLALRRAVEATRGPLSEELTLVVGSVDLGGRWRDELRAAAERMDLPDLRRAVTALTRTETLGSSLAESMSDLAAGVREARSAATTERARKAPVKMLFPLVFLVLPAFLLLTVVPVLFSTVQSIR